METKIWLVRRILYFLLGIRIDADTHIFDTLQKITPQHRIYETTIHKQRIYVQYLYSYKDVCVRKAIWRMKFNDDRKYIDFFAKQLSDELLRCAHTDGISILPIPTTQSRTRQRGSWTTLQLTVRIQKNLKDKGVDVSVDTTSLQRHNSPKQSHHKHRTERLNAMREIFFARYPDALQNVHVLCIDDVCTTGSTIADMHRACIDAGCASLDVWVIAH